LPCSWTRDWILRKDPRAKKRVSRDDRPPKRKLVPKRPVDTAEQRYENLLAIHRELMGAVHMIREAVEEYMEPEDLADSEQFEP
jgi:hypothetical protein